MSKSKIDVAIALLFFRGKVLVGWREAKQHQGNKYEFPGGKVEIGESPEQACRREIREEVGIDVTDWHTCQIICHEYEDITVNLHVFHASVSSSQLAQIQAPWTWYSRDTLATLNFPKANDVLIQHLNWQRQIKISIELNDLISLSNTHLMYWRVEEHEVNITQLARLSAVDFAKLIVNVNVWQQMNTEQQQQVAAVHLKHSQLMQRQKGDLVDQVRYIAACHNEVSAQHAQAIGCDAILLSPILPTTSHHDAKVLGWQGLHTIAMHIDIPVFALGGMQVDNLRQAQQYGAYGIAGIRFI